MARVTILLIAAFLISCGSTPPPMRTIRHQDLIVDGDKRLSDDVIPTSYEVSLNIDPAKETFSGVVRIAVDFKKKTEVVYLHALKMDVKDASVTLEEGKTLTVDAGLGAKGGAALILSGPAQGKGIIEIHYEAPLGKAPTGLYRVKDDGDWYAFTQFEPLEARQAFPCFDEPRFKTPFTITIITPKGLTAISNTPEAKKTESDTQAEFTFEQTTALPTYLVAFAVGKFDIVEAEADAIPGVPFRIITTKGKAKYADFMLKRTPKLMALLIAYFGGTFPYKKLDMVAVPNFSAGAMENVGLVTFREKLILLDGETASVQDRRAALSVTAHELAHMWFGNLVTMPWWNDLWLNESFATWMANRVMRQVAPVLETHYDVISRTQRILEGDGLRNARQIRQPIKSSGDVYNAFDGITYQKGAATLAMIETWIGEEALQQGVQAYLKAHAHGSGSTEDFLAEVDKASGKPVSTVFNTFLDQPGAPLLEVDLSCEAEPTVNIKQSRYFSGTGEGDASWQLPICIRYQDKRTSAVHCELLTTKTATIKLPTGRCPKWIHPNADEVGYYRWRLSQDAFEALATKHRSKLSVEERIGLWGNLRAATRAQKLPADTYIKALMSYLKETPRPIVENIIGAMNQLDRYVPDEKRKSWNRVASKLTRRRARKLGFKKRKNESPTDTILRAQILKANVRLAGDKNTLKGAHDVTDQFLGNMGSITTDVLYTALPISAWDGDSGLWLKYKMTVVAAPPGARRAVLQGLGSFRDPMLHRKSLDLLLDGTLRSQDFWSVIGPSFSRDETFAVTWEWFTKNYDKISTLLGTKSTGSLPWLATGFCSPEGKAAAIAFFEDPKHQGLGGERNLKNALESVDICIREEAYLAPSLLEYLK